MAQSNPVVNLPPLSVYPAGQPLRSNAFSDIAFAECPNELPLDLNFSQKLPQKGPNEFRFDPICQQKDLEASPSSQQDTLVKTMPECATSSGALDCYLSKTVVDGTLSKTPKGVSASQRSRCHWSHGEVIALLDAKKAQEERFEKDGRKMKSSSERWDEIVEFCSSQGVKKLSSQCKDKWERLWPAYRKILDWDRQPPLGKSSYWTMLGDEREREGFPRAFDKELYDAMSSRFGFVKPLNLSSIVVDSSNEDSVEAATNLCDEPVQNGTAAFEDGPSVVDDHTPTYSGRKRKSSATLNCVKQPPAEGNKRVVLCLEANEENVALRSSKDLHLKNKSADFAERRLLLEERKQRLAERRVIFEERKLEVTIEIGKGLITSMEKMADAISSIRASSSPML